MSGDVDIVSSVPLTIGQVTASIGISGDVRVIATDFDIRNLSTTLDAVSIGRVTVPIGISGDVFTREQNVIGSQIVGGAVGGKVGLSGDTGVELIDSAGTNRATIFSTGSLKTSGDRLVSQNGDYGAVAVTSASTQIIGARDSMKQCMFTSFGTIYIGLDSSVTASTGEILYSGDVYSDSGEGMYTGGIWGITSSGSVNVRYSRRW